MTDQLPERFYGIPFKDDESPHWLGQFWSVRCSEDDIELLRADTVIPRSQADAMVAAAYLDASERALEWFNDGWMGHKHKLVEAGLHGWVRRGARRPARAAFERAVQEAVEVERERIVKIVAGYVGCDNIVDAIRAPQETSE